MPEPGLDCHAPAGKGLRLPVCRIRPAVAYAARRAFELQDSGAGCRLVGTGEIR